MSKAPASPLGASASGFSSSVLGASISLSVCAILSCGDWPPHVLGSFRAQTAARPPPPPAARAPSFPGRTGGPHRPRDPRVGGAAGGGADGRAPAGGGRDRRRDGPLRDCGPLGRGGGRRRDALRPALLAARARHS